MWGLVWVPIWRVTRNLTEFNKIRKGYGGDGGIRTLGAEFSARRFSKPLVSATHPRLQTWPEYPLGAGQRLGEKRYNGGFRARQRVYAMKFLQTCPQDSFQPRIDSGRRSFIVVSACFPII